jgi:hypothetical protein
MSVEYHVWQLNEINRRILENRIWSGAYHADIEFERSADRRAKLIASLQTAQTDGAGDLIDLCAESYVGEIKSYLIEGIRCSIAD